MAFLKTALALVFLAVLTPATRAQVSAMGESQLKAAFLENFARFVEWPPASLPPTGAPFVIGLVGDNRFGSVLLETTHGASVAGRPIVVRSLRWNETLTGCQILFIGASEVQHLAEINAAIATSSVLTVADFDSFARRGGMIEFRMIDNRVRFDINNAAATNAGLRISSKLLSLAHTIQQ